MAIIEDWDIVSKINSGNEELYEKLVSKYQKPLFNFVLFMVNGNHHLAEDILQETFIRAYKNLKTLTPKSQFSTWLYKIAKNLYIDYYRKAKVEVDLTQVNLIDYKNPESITISMEYKQLLKKLILELKDEYRVVLCLRSFQGFSYEEISEVIGCPLGTVRSRLSRAREIIREQLNNHFPEDKGGLKDAL